MQEKFQHLAYDAAMHSDLIINLNCHMLWAQGLEGLPNNPFWTSSMMPWKTHVFSHGSWSKLSLHRAIHISCLGQGVAPSPGTGAPAEGRLLSTTASSNSSLTRRNSDWFYCHWCWMFIFHKEGAICFNSSELKNRNHNFSWKCKEAGSFHLHHRKTCAYRKLQAYH